MRAEIAAGLPHLEWMDMTGDNAPAALALCVIDVRGTTNPHTERLAYWRDVGAHQVLVLADAAVDRESLLAMAFNPVADTGAVHIWGHHIADYKRTPDWLNPRFWANPERWDAERW